MLFKLQETNPIRKLEPSELSEQQQKINQLSRVTVVIEDASQNYGLVTISFFFLTYCFQK